jgi:hypothetical protein
MAGERACQNVFGKKRSMEIVVGDRVNQRCSEFEFGCV